MKPPVFQLLTASADVVSLVADRVYAFGAAPQDVARPYVVWQVLTGAPTSMLDGLPPDDRVAVQIDAYADSELSADQTLEALLTALDTAGYVTSFGSDVRDDITARYRVRLDADLFVNR